MGDDQQLEAVRPGRRPLPGEIAAALRKAGRPALAGRGSLYLLLPSLLAVFGSWRSLAHLDWPFAGLVLVCEVASYAWLWQLDRIALRTTAWFAVATAQLSGNLAGRILPGGGATAAALSASLLHDAGAETGDAVAAFGRPRRSSSR